jgi:hypothetical protein
VEGIRRSYMSYDVDGQKEDWIMFAVLFEEFKPELITKL